MLDVGVSIERTPPDEGTEVAEEIMALGDTVKQLKQDVEDNP